jgi:hypothetical protein
MNAPPTQNAIPGTVTDSQHDSMVSEYHQGIELLRHWSTMRRQDIAFVTTIQGAVLTILGKALPHLDVAQYALTVIAFYVILLGINSERRLAAYCDGYVSRVKTLEPSIGMALLSAGAAHVDREHLLVSNKRMFLTYYGVLLTGWITLWLSNLSMWLRP